MLVFAYGSLLWRPGFKPREIVPATAHGWQRKWCVRSTVHRGTRQLPGIVLGLVEGGSCSGLLYAIESCDCGKVAQYLELREMAEAGYRPEVVSVETAAGRAEALAYVSDAAHRLEADPGDILQAMLHARGSSGTNAEYASETFQAMDDLGIRLCEQETGVPEEMLMTIRAVRDIPRTARGIPRTENNIPTMTPQTEMA